MSISEKLNFGKNDVLGVRGSFGTVYKGKLNGKLDVAIRQVEKMRTKVEESDYYYSTNGHPNVVNFYCIVANHTKFTYLVSELCAGNLQDFLLDKTPLIDISPKEVLRQIVKGVQHLHLLKIVHGNLKPSNILVSCPKGDVGPMLKVADFGLRHALHSEWGRKEVRFIPASTEGWVCPFDPMDEKRQRTYSFDIFSLALLFGFVAAKGVHPYGSNLEEAIRRMKKQKPIILLLEHVDESIRSESFLDLLNQMLSYDATKRPSTSYIIAHDFFKIHFVISVPRQQEEVVHMEPLLLSPSDSSSDEDPPKRMRPIQKDSSQTAFVSHFARVAERRIQTQENRILDDAAKRSVQLLREIRPNISSFQFPSPQVESAYLDSTLTADELVNNDAADDAASQSEQLVIQPEESSNRESAESSGTPLEFNANEVENSCPVSTTQYDGEAANSSLQSTSEEAITVGQDAQPLLQIATKSRPISTPSKKKERASTSRPLSTDEGNSTEEETSTSNYNFQCKICHKRFTTKGNMTRHTVTHTGARPFKCSICDQQFSRRSHLDSHNTIVHDKIKSFECELCKKRFASKRDVSMHMNRHTGDRPFKCSQCPKRYGDPSNLREHVKMHSEPTYECEFCGEKFKQLQSLKKHRDGYFRKNGIACKARREKLAAVQESSQSQS